MSTKFSDFQIFHDLAGINFSDFIISSSDTYEVYISGFPMVSSSDETSQEAHL